MDGKSVKKDSPNTRRFVKPLESKVCGSIREACERCGAHDGMTFSFHTEFRDGDYVAGMVAKVLVEEMGLKDITVAATSLGNAQDVIADYIEDGRVIGVQTSGVRGRIGEVISAGRLKTPAERCILISRFWLRLPPTAAAMPRAWAERTTAVPWDLPSMIPILQTTRLS